MLLVALLRGGVVARLRRVARSMAANRRLATRTSSGMSSPGERARVRPRRLPEQSSPPLATAPQVGSHSPNWDRPLALASTSSSRLTVPIFNDMIPSPGQSPVSARTARAISARQDRFPLGSAVMSAKRHRVQPTACSSLPGEHPCRISVKQQRHHHRRHGKAQHPGPEPSGPESMTHVPASPATISTGSAGNDWPVLATGREKIRCVAEPRPAPVGPTSCTDSRQSCGTPNERLSDTVR